MNFTKFEQNMFTFPEDENEENKHEVGEVDRNAEPHRENFKENPTSFKGSYKIDPKTPIFKSKPDEDIETWLYKMETALCAGGQCALGPVVDRCG